MQTTVKKRKNSVIGLKKDILFYSLMLIWPLAQFAVFYIGVNFNSFLLAFKTIKMDVNQLSYTYTWSVKGFVDAWELLKTPEIIQAAKMSLLVWLLGTVVSVPLGLLFSHYIAKKMTASGFFRVVLFLPSILSSMVVAMIFTYFLDEAIPKLILHVFDKEVISMLDPGSPVMKIFGTLFFYSIWVGFGVHVLMYANTMSGISPEIVEAANLDGATGIKEFWHVSLPQVYPTLSVFLVTGVALMFTNQFNLFTFYAGDAPFWTFGYYLYKETQKYKTDMAYYPRLSAFGLMMTTVAVPLTFVVRNLLEKFGPRED